MRNEPQPYGAVPSQRQLAWHRLETYGFIHFTVNTFTDLEWGYGDESPSLFDPTDFDAGQIAEAAVAGGLEGLILTAKHHDGFCLWPSRYTEHSLEHSPFRGGKGDVVRDLSEACRKAKIRFGIYLSPWDRNHPDYARPAYIEYYRNQLRELLSEYGEVFEVWFDGANGGDGYYGGARETRRIDARTYYDWHNTWQIVRELQPNACMFSDAGPDIRWIGNEKGIAGDPCLHTMDASLFAPGDADVEVLKSGIRGGKDWLPAECDVSIRPGWFYHQSEDSEVRSPENLLDLYYRSVGRGASLNLNLPPDGRGRINERDVRSLTAFNRRLKTIFTRDVAGEASTRVDSIRGDGYGPSNLTDGDETTYWASHEDARRAEITLRFRSPVSFNVVELREPIRLGQRLEKVVVDVFADSRWQPYAECRGVGYRRLMPGNTVGTTRVRVRVEESSACPLLSRISLYRDPEVR
jgi:alpha-L-fucosidase